MASRRRYILASGTADPNDSDFEPARFDEARADEFHADDQSEVQDREQNEGDVTEWSSTNEQGSEQNTESSSSSDSESDEDSESSTSSSGTESDSDLSILQDDQEGNTTVRENPQGNQQAVSSTSPQLTHEAAEEASRGDPSNDRMDRLERVLADMATAMTRLQSYDPASSSRLRTDTSWNFPSTSASTASTPSTIRWDNIKPFPAGVPANKMWEEWNRYIENFEIAASLNNATDPPRRTQLLFLSMGPDLQEIILAAKLRPSLEDRNCYQIFVDNIHNYFRSMTDTAAEHEAFSCMKQGKDESAVAYHARLMCKVRLCNYSPQDQDRFVRAQLLKGLKNRKLVRQARTYGHDTNFIVQAATRDEAYEAEVAQPPEANVFAVLNNRYASNNERNRKRKSLNDRDGEPPMKRRQQNYEQSHRSQDYGQDRYSQDYGQDRRSQDYGQGRRSRCARCYLMSHRYGTCPAERKNCLICGQRGHFKAACRKKRVNAIQFKREDPESDMSEDEAQIATKQCVNALSLEDVLIGCSLGSSSSIRFLIDSGADVNIVGGQDWERLKYEFDSGKAKLEMVQRPNKRIHAYGSKDPMVVECSFKAKVSVKDVVKPSVIATFFVVRKGFRSLLGRSTASDLKLLQVGSAVNNCETSNNIGEFPKMPGVTVKFSVNKAIPPTKNAYYNVPAAYREAARQRLREMESRGIIEKVTSAPNWISGMSAVPKGKNDFRLVVNMRAPNRAINREYFRLPHIEEMKVKLHGAQYFSKLDLSNAFHHLELSEESRDLTTFLTEDGMYRFTRLMFGVNCAPEVFQREMTRILKGVGNLIVYIDDVLIYARTLEELRRTVAEVLKILKENNLTLNTGKCEFDKTRIKFLGHELDGEGFHIDEEKISSVRNFREPTTLSELRSFLGLASFIGPYLKNFAEISSPLWAATTSKTWTWGHAEKEAFNLIKQQIVDCTVALGYFSENDRTILYTDASPRALGAVLVQEKDRYTPRIISFASKALTATEKDYPQNQREALGAVWAVEHFSFYLLGRNFTLRTDAQGVAFILNRSREESKRVLTRAEGWALRLSPYNYDVQYVRGRDNIADSSSRLYCGEDGPFDEDANQWEIACLEANSIEFLTEQDIRDATAEDETLQKVTSALDTGRWPKDIRRYQAIENDLSMQDGILIKTGCAVVPESLRTKALQVAHEGHPTTAKMRSIIRQRVWWPEISKDVQKWVDGCRTCAVNGKPEKPTPMERVFVPKTVWETIAMDFNGPYVKFGGVSILVIVDYRSRYLFARPVKSTCFEFTRKVLDEIFQKEGYPKRIKTDNGPPFSGDEYKQFCRQRGIETVYSTPLYPQQNGLVESCMKVINKAMVAASTDKTNFVEELRQAVDAHNAAAHTVTKVPPEEVMLGRKIKRGLPLLRHEKATFDEKLFEKNDRESKLSSKFREDARRGARECKVKPGDMVIVERHSRAKGESRFAPKPYTVIEERNGSLTLTDDRGQALKRHVSQTRRITSWRNSCKSAESDTGKSRTLCAEPAGTTAAKATDTTPATAAPPRAVRKRQAPTHLRDYVRSIDDTNTAE